ncbi:MAG: aminodeoxychorismate/anthranilate synthase component II [Candidatus Adiutrix sp.]|jgi:anthranilate synthase component 2|nr:aminodeoxychorismate/anthranilate synthase component II [Candidatus Adiutrix sp.]
MKILLIDNYDSFTYNLVHMLKRLLQTGDSLRVLQNDDPALSLAGDYDKIILSPGPGLPGEAGDLLEVIKRFGRSRSILGVCLGHQAICGSFGAALINAPRVFHGVCSEISILKAPYIFTGLPATIKAGRYHSWYVDHRAFPAEMDITAVDQDGLIMAASHKTYDLHGVQFHPESIMTPLGKDIISNFIGRPSC